MAEAYKNAGVDIHAGYEAVSLIKKHIKSTNRTGVMGNIGAFGGLFDLSAIAAKKEPVLVSGTDGVGTKLKLAFDLDRHDTIGIDAVAMCVNDIISLGAEPLFFLDYIACDAVRPKQIEAIVKGISEGCKQSNCALVGGETAEMHGMYNPGEYDIAGFAVGIAEKSELITGENIKEGDLIIGLPSSGVHSNGFSLIRKIILDKNLSLEKDKIGVSKVDGVKVDGVKIDEMSLGEVLLTPTKIYVKTVLTLLETIKIKGIAHITGGGFIENIPRILPDGLSAQIKKGSWHIPEIFPFLQEHGQIPEEEMYNIFNMGVGMVLVISPDENMDEANIKDHVNLKDRINLKNHIIGKVVTGSGVHFA